MIEFRVEGKVVVARINFGDPIAGYSIDFEFECPGEQWSKLLHDNVRNSYHDAVKAAREEEYKKGRTDERAHRARPTWFYHKLEAPK